jgi:hypothetical protein
LGTRIKPTESCRRGLDVELLLEPKSVMGTRMNA